MAKKKANPAANFLQGLLSDEPVQTPAPEPAAPAAAYDTVLSIDDIQNHPYNRQVDIEGEDAAQLRESILLNGFTDKVQVLTRENAEALGVEGLGPQPYVALNCHHRLAICRKLRPDILTVEAVIRSFSTQLDMLYIIADYNAARPLLTSERAKQIRRIKGEVARTLQPGEDTFTLIAKRMGKSRTMIYMLDAITELNEELLPFVDTGDVILRDAVELRKLPDEAQKKLAQGLSNLNPGLPPEGRKAAVRLLIGRAKAAERGEDPAVSEEKPAKKSAPRDLAKAVQAVCRALPAEGEEVVAPRYRKTVEPMVKGMDEALSALARQRQKFPQHPLSDSARAALLELLKE